VQQASRGCPSKDNQVGAVSSPVANLTVFPCFSSVLRQMPGYDSKGTRPASPVTEAFSQSDSNTSWLNSQKSHTTKIPLIKANFSDGGNPPVSAISLV
jgi:hypothetical protein